MGKEEPEKPAEDKRDKLTRNFGPKYYAFLERQHSDALKSLENVPRPVSSSVYFRHLPLYQASLTYFATFFFVMRKLPFTNPLVRINIWLLGIDLMRSVSKNYQGLVSWEDRRELECFDYIKFKTRSWITLRTPDFLEEWEDWYLFNKPAYRVPVGHEDSPDSLARYIFINSHKFKKRDVQWHGEWEQENALVMDMFAPHADYWLTTH